MDEKEFSDFYKTVYGERWETLRRRLVRETAPEAYNQGLKQPYFLDGASIEAASLVKVQPGERVLDMCAAPGGKSLIIASQLPLNRGNRLISNDRSSQRRRRLIKVLDDHLPKERRLQVEVTSHDASKWGLYEQNLYDWILLDAPCSSERHLLHQPKLLKQWTPGRTKNLAVQQYAMAAAALTACRPGGRILYSTCSLSPRENEGIIQRLLKKKGDLFQLIEIEGLVQWEHRDPGYLCLPEEGRNQGPLYVCMMEKR